MSKLARIITIIIVAFVLLSLCLYRLQLHRAKVSLVQGQGEISAIEEVEEAEGEIQTFDEETRTLTLVGNSRPLAFSFDKNTAVVQSGHSLQPATIRPGARARVKYQKKGRRLLAREIRLMPAGS